MTRRRLLLGTALGLFSSALAWSAPAISAEALLARTKALASDELEGRGPGTLGEQRTVAYLEAELRRLGLAPGNPDGSYVQAVPMYGVSSSPQVSWSLKGQARQLKTNVDVVAPSLRLDAQVSLKNSEMVFVGYGISAPEFGWDDYAGLDVRGKTVVMLINDPPIELAGKPGQLDPAVFGGKAMTYYGRWTYKYENAQAHGAAACLIVHETAPAAYPFSVVVDSRSRENFTLASADRNASRMAVEGWLSLETAEALLKAEGKAYAELKAAAAKPGFRGVPLQGRLDFSIANKAREINSANVVGLLPGRDAKLKNEYIVLSAHWDHLGREESLKGDQIYNGARDNASGVAQILGIAEALKALPAAEAPRRSILVLFPTAEEKGLLGARHYAEHPLYPLEKTLADLNVDGANAYVPTDDIEVVGFGASSLEDLAVEAAREQGRVIVPDSGSERGSYYRADHFEFARAGVPAFYPGVGNKYRGKPADFGKKLLEDYIATRYHKVTDEVQPDWTMEGGALDAEFLARLCLKVDASDTWPEWKSGNEFKARREASLKAAAKR